MEKEKKKLPVLPWYLAAAAWALMMIFPAASMVGFVIRGIIVSVVVFAVVLIITLMARRKKERSAQRQAEQNAQKPPEKEAHKPSGNPEIDKLMEDGDKAISEMRRLNDNIEDPEISRQIDELEQVTLKIFDHVIQNPEKLPQIRRFLNYYLPTTLKILNAYDRMGAQGVSGENIDSTMEKVEAMMDTIVRAFHRQLDELFGAEAMDVATEITVLENMMYREGLIDKPFDGI